MSWYFSHINLFSTITDFFSRNRIYLMIALFFPTMIYGQTAIEIPYTVNGAAFKADVSVYFSLRECNEVKPIQMNNLDGNLSWDVDNVNFPCVNFEISGVLWQKPEHNNFQVRVTVALSSQRSGLQGITPLTKILETGTPDNIRMAVNGNSARRANLTITITPIIVSDPRQEQVIIQQRYRIANYSLPSELPDFKPESEQIEEKDPEPDEDDSKKEEKDVLAETSSADQTTDKDSRSNADRETKQRSVRNRSEDIDRQQAETEIIESVRQQFRPEYKVERHASTFLVRFSNLDKSFQVVLQNPDEKSFYLINQDKESFSVFVDNDERNVAMVVFENISDTLQIPFYTSDGDFATTFEIDRNQISLNIRGGDAPYLLRFLRHGLQFPLHEIELKDAGEHQIPLREIRANVTGKVNIELLDARRMSVENYEGVVIPGGFINPRIVFLIFILAAIGSILFWQIRKRRQLIPDESENASDFDIDSAKDRMRTSIRRNMKTK